MSRTLAAAPTMPDLEPKPTLPVTQVSIGRFHHFHLARELERRGMLDTIWTGYPRFKLRDELGIPAERLRTFPWLQTIYMALCGRGVDPRSRAMRELAWAAHETLDRRVAASLREPTVLVALSGSGRSSGRRAQQMGGRHICDRGSTHIRYQHELLSDEYARWGLPFEGVDPRSIDKEEAEYDAADVVTVPSGFTYRSFIEKGVPESKLRKVPYGGRLDRFRPVGEPDPERLDVLFVGAASLRKGVPYLLQAFARVRHPRKRLRLMGQVAPELSALLGRLPTDGVEFLGSVPNHTLPHFYGAAHMMVLPSIEEGLAMVMGEALACGCPVIATPNTGAEDIFEAGHEGMVVPARDVAALAAAMQNLADDPMLSVAMRHAAQQRIAAIGGWNEYGERYAAVVTEVGGMG
jgi:glycosyltransferase involved in cell wall biosynthesis